MAPYPLPIGYVPAGCPQKILRIVIKDAHVNFVEACHIDGLKFAKADDHESKSSEIHSGVEWTLRKKLPIDGSTSKLLGRCLDSREC